MRAALVGSWLPLLAALVLAPVAGAATGRELFLEGCSSCHGLDARGVHGRGPSLVGAGAAAADFYLSTGRMPLDNPRAEPERSEPAYPRDQIDALVHYVASLGPGPAVPHPDPRRGSLAEGQRLFADKCAGCHQIVARGGVVTGGFSPPLQAPTTKQIWEAVRIGPWVMPVFDRHRVSDAQLASIAKYVRSTRDPDDRGGWGIGNSGPVPEGMVTWLLGAAALLLVARVIGEARR